MDDYIESFVKRVSPVWIPIVMHIFGQPNETDIETNIEMNIEPNIATDINTQNDGITTIDDTVNHKLTKIVNMEGLLTDKPLNIQYDVKMHMDDEFLTSFKLTFKQQPDTNLLEISVVREN